MRQGSDPRGECEPFFLGVHTVGEPLPLPLLAPALPLPLLDGAAAAAAAGAATTGTLADAVLLARRCLELLLHAQLEQLLISRQRAHHRTGEVFLDVFCSICPASVAELAFFLSFVRGRRSAFLVQIQFQQFQRSLQRNWLETLPPADRHQQLASQQTAVSCRPAADNAAGRQICYPIPAVAAAYRKS